MQVNQTKLVLCMGASFLLLGGCSSLSSKSGQASTTATVTTPKIKVITAQSLKEESKSIAVTDIYYKKEGKNSTYVEETLNKVDSNSIDSPAPKVVAVDADKADASALAGGASSSAFPVKFTNLADPKAVDPNTPPVAADVPVVKSSSSSITTQVSKKSGYESKSEYGELRYLASPIRALLIRSGYKVVQANATVAIPTEGDEYFDIVRRIKAGDFTGANYVLYGVLSETSYTDNVDTIPGTISSSEQIALDVVVDFNLVDTDSYQIVASFIASGGGHEVRIDGKDSGFKPSMAKLMKQASVSLAEDVQRQLADQNFVTANPAQAQADSARNFKRRLDDDASSLKVYGK